MLKRYELTDEEWSRIVDLLPPENTGKQGRPRKNNRDILNGMVWIARNGAPWHDLPERYGSWKTVYSRLSNPERNPSPVRSNGNQICSLDFAAWSLSV